MELLALVLAGLAFLVALVALTSAKVARANASEASTDARREARNVADEVSQALDVQRKLLARLAGGEAVDPQMVLDGQLWRDVDDASGKDLVTSRDELVVLDVAMVVLALAIWQLVALRRSGARRVAGTLERTT